ncbi:copia protein, partial [Tanacetum coccineum]
MHTMTLNPPDDNWYMDTGASSHMTTSQGTLSPYLNMSTPRHIIAGNGHSIPIQGYGHASLPSPYPPLHLKNVLYTPHLIKNLISVRRLSIDNNISITFDPFGFTVKDYKTGIHLMRCDSSGDLYPLTTSALQKVTSPSTFAAFSQDLWHKRLGHPGANILNLLKNKNYIECNRTKASPLCEPCVFGKHVKLPFNDSTSRTFSPFDIVHSDKIIICRHVLFDKTKVLFASPHPSKPDQYEFLHDYINPYFLYSPLSTDTTPNSNPNQHISSPSSPTQPTSPQLLSPSQSNNNSSPLNPSSQTTTTHTPHHSSSNTPQPRPTMQSSLLQSPRPHSPSAYRASRQPSIQAPSRTMTTRSMSDITKTKTPFNLFTSTTPSPLPQNPREAFHDPNWKQAMNDEFNALIDNKTWELVPRTPNMHIIRSMWIYKHNLNSDGSFERYKARLVGDGRSRQVGIDCTETFSPVVKPATIRVVLSLALSNSWPIHQLDVKNAFLHGHLNETVYMYQPMRFRDPTYPDHVCLLKRSLYGLKQAPRAWYQRFADFFSTIGFIHSRSDHSFSIYKKGRDVAYILLYVDDIILTASSDTLRCSIMKHLADEFAMKDLGSLSYFLGIAVTRTTNGLFLSRSKYAREILERAGMSSFKPSHTPVDTEGKLSSEAAHMDALKRILRYIQGTLHFGLQLTKSSIHGLVSYTDTDWAGCPDTRRSTSGYCVYLGDNLISWSSKRQPTLSRSSAEAEYRGVANVVFESCWIRNLLLELHYLIHKATIVYWDNVSAIYLSSNPIQHQRTKHIELDIHFVREKVARGHVRVLHVPSRYQIADIFTKGLPRVLFDDFRDSLN